MGKTNLPQGFSEWSLLDDLKTGKDFQRFLSLCFEEDPGDGSLILAALEHIARAKGGMQELAEKTGMTRQGLYKSLSKKGNPEFTTIMKITRALGVKLTGTMA
jgi:probable addiction module antidote protein